MGHEFLHKEEMMSDEETRGSGRREKPVVRVERRRRTEPTGQGRERAEAPKRQGREAEGRVAPSPARTSETPPATTGPARQTTPAGIPLPSLGGKSIWLLLGLGVVFLCVIGAMMLLGGGGDGDNGGAALLPTEPLLPTESFQPTEPVASLASPVPTTPRATTKPFVAPTRSAKGQTWLVMLYQDADDKILEKDIYVDLNEAERIGSSDRVQMVAQVDRFAGAFSGDGDWTSTKRFYITQNNDLNVVRSEVLADLGEVNMADGDTLVDFVTWAIENFPADRHVLILSDHGMGWPGGWSDPAPGGRGDRSTPLAAALGDELYLNEMDQALQTIRDQVGLDKFEVIGLDACLMGHLEVLSALAPHARYAVVSQEVEPALGWAYASFLKELQKDPDMTGAELGQFVVGSYVEEDQRIVDDEARADLLRQNSPMGGLFGFVEPASAAEVARQMGQNATLSAIDLSAVPALIDSTNQLFFTLQQASQNEVARARSYAQSFTSIFGREVPPSYIDLGHFAQLLKQTRAGAAVGQAADGVLAALDQAVVAEKHGSAKPGATGVSIYFPNSQLFGSPVTGAQSYTAIADRFAEESLWDDFLAFHYTGRPFEAAAQQAAVPPANATVTGPGAGKIELSPVQASATVAAPGRPVLLSTDISGDNVGYVLLFTGFYDRQSNSIFVADTDYLESSDTREIDGVYYPVWPEGEFTMEFEWEPLMFAISDGETSVTASLTPIAYGATFEDAVYAVDGIYTYTSGESRYARLLFRDGWLRQVYGFTGQDGTGAPREIYPEQGDTFTVLERWMDLDSQGKVVKRASQEGGTLTFGSQMFSWEEQDAAPGEYLIGFIVQDLDGNSYQAYKTLTVK